MFRNNKCEKNSDISSVITYVQLVIFFTQFVGSYILSV